MKRIMLKLFTLALMAGLLQGCNALSRLSEVGEGPKLSRIENPTRQPGYQPVDMPMPQPNTATAKANSLWRTGARGFFKDQRASAVGDILTVFVQVDDGATLANTSGQVRGDDTDSVSVGALGGLEDTLDDVLPESVDPTNLADVTSSRNIHGEGGIDRTEEVNVKVAAVVTQVLPNGNLVVQGKQQLRVNYEMRELLVSGIIRREDISSRNTISSKQIAELRLAYGGRGTISDMQQPRYGRQIMDIILPF